jgi:hypothetical protein
MPPVLSTAPTEQAGLLGLLIGQLAEGPIGHHPLFEAALLWSGHRPAGWRELGPPTPRRHVTIIRLDRLDPALRAARLLCGLTWAVVEDGPGGTHDVAVSAAEWHRIIRCLTATRREGARRLGVRGPGVDNRPLALAAWRAALLGSLKELDSQRLTVRIANRPLRDLLLAAAPALELDPICYSRRADEFCMVISGRRNVLRLIELATG